MEKIPATNKIIIPTILAFVLSSISFVFASELSSKKIENGLPSDENSITDFPSEAKSYRAQGFQMQKAGNIDGAMAMYQKAISLDPGYAVPYNDLGIIFESKGDIDRAEEYYAKAIGINPNYAEVYSNLAQIYENKRDLSKAAYFWKKRVELGFSDDPWTVKAKQRIKDINIALGGSSAYEEQEVTDLVNNVSDQKTLERKDDKQLAKSLFDKAKASYQKGDEITALKKANDAQQLDPANEEIQAFIDKIQLRLLSK